MNSFNQITSFPLLLIHLGILLLLLLMSIIQCPLASHGCHEQERRALLNIKSSLEDPSHRLASWQDSVQHQNCCDWRGIGCSSETFHVISIDLRNIDYDAQILFSQPQPNTALRGTISHSLFNITHLEYLDLAFNDFNLGFDDFYIGLNDYLGSNITQFSYLTKLAHLDLSHSGFSESISTQFSNLSSLEYLDLSCKLFPRRNSFVSTSCSRSSSLKWLRGLVNLRVLRLSGIDLSEATPSNDISSLWNLRDLDISGCEIFSPVFPIHEFHNLSRLSSLKMGYNFHINSSIPIQLANLTSLSILHLSNCDLQGTIPYLPQLKELNVSDNKNLDPDLLNRMFQLPWPKLQTLQISGNQLNESIPSSISNAPLLTSLSATDCSIHRSLPSSIYNLSRLQYLDLSENNITSSIHSSISNLKYLRFLDLSKNNIFGSIPKSICEIFSLQQLVLESNQITGSIPSCITKLRNLSVFEVSSNSIGGEVSIISLINGLDLTSLDLSSNKLTLAIDDQHLHPSRLENLMLKSCRLQRSVPTSICSLNNLRYLDLSFSNITGAIPPCIYKLRNLKSLDLSNNRLRGPLPLLPPGVDALYLSNNKLNGEISIENGEILSSSRSIVLYGNELSGSIPSSICSQAESDGLNFIDLSNNQLSGTIPPSIGYCSSLKYLNLGGNNLTGNVPNELQQAEDLRYLQLSNNSLNGTFPKFIEKLTSLNGLDIGYNNFEGVIPIGLGSLYDLGILSLRSNKFNGSIPEDIFLLDKLQVLDLSINNLLGPIPKKIGNLKRLTAIITEGRQYRYGFQDSRSSQFHLVIKGTMTQLVQDYTYISGIDLSCNILDGNIPEEIGFLQGLVMLNLSHNYLSNNIPATVGNMSSLESLDLSSNGLSGHIPQSLTLISYLGSLNLSYNNLSGKIPRETHFDTLGLEGSVFAGNDLLCGFPLEKDCEDDNNVHTNDANRSNQVDEDDYADANEKFLLYAIIAMGSAVGFWGLFCVLLLWKQKWWFPYWRIVDFVAVKIIEGCIHKD